MLDKSHLDAWLSSYTQSAAPPPPPPVAPKIVKPPDLKSSVDSFLASYVPKPITMHPQGEPSSAMPPPWIEQGVFWFNPDTGEKRLKNSFGGLQTVDLNVPPEPVLRVEPGSVKEAVRDLLFSDEYEENLRAGRELELTPGGVREKQGAPRRPITPRSEEDVEKAVAADVPLQDKRYAVGPLQGEQFWSPQPGLNQPPDDIPLDETASPIVRRDPETGMVYAAPSFEGGESGVNYADWATREGMTEPGFRGDIVKLNKPQNLKASVDAFLETYVPKPLTMHPQASKSVAAQPPEWAAEALPTAEATPEALFGQPEGMEVAAEALLRGVAGTKAGLGGLASMVGDAMLPEPEPKRSPEEQAAVEKMRDIYSVGGPPPTASAMLAEGLGQKAVKVGKEAKLEDERAAEALPRPEYAQDVLSGLSNPKTAMQTVAVISLEALPNLAATIAATAVNPALGFATAFGQEAGAAYSETGNPQEALYVGLTNGFLEYLPAGKAVMALKGATKGEAKKLITLVIKQANAEGRTETLQEVNNMIAAAAVDAKARDMSFRDVAARLVESYVGGTVLGGGVGAMTSGTGKAAEAVRTGLPGDQALVTAKESERGEAIQPSAIQAIGAPEAGQRPAAAASERQPPAQAVVDSSQLRPAEVPLEASPGPPTPAAPVDRRLDPTTRRRVSEMTPEEKDLALLTDELTGLGNRRAWEEQAADKPVQVALDVDGLKWVNDNFGHNAGSDLLRAVGKAMENIGGYRLQGDEFAFAANNEAEARAQAEELQSRLANTRLRYTAKDGTVLEVPIGVSYGIGENYEQADERSLAAKAERTARGLRAERGAKPPGVVAVPAEGREAGGGRAADEAVRPGSLRQVAVTEAGTEIPFRWEVVEADDLLTSHDTRLRPEPRYPPDLQPRDRTRVASEVQVARIARSIDPERLAENRLASHGAPIVGQDMAVESGNARSIALKRAYEADPEARGYRPWLAANASRFGLAPEAVAGMRRPILVRVSESPVNRAQVAREANVEAVASMSTSEQARIDADKLAPEVLDLWDQESGDITAAANRDFVRAFLARVEPSEMGRLVDAEGALSQDGVRRLQAALLVSAYGDPAIASRTIESTDDNTRNIGRALLAVAPRFASQRRAMETGKLHKLDIAPHIAEAARKLAALRDVGLSVPDYLSQQGMFGQELSDQARALLKVFDENRRSSKRLTEVLNDFADRVEGIGSPKQAGLFGVAEPNAMDLLLESAKQEKGVVDDESAVVGGLVGGGQVVSGKVSEAGRGGLPLAKPAAEGGVGEPAAGRFEGAEGKASRQREVSAEDDRRTARPSPSEGQRAGRPAGPSESLEARALALARSLNRRPKLPELQRELGIPYTQAKTLWPATKGWEVPREKAEEAQKATPPEAVLRGGRSEPRERAHGQPAESAEASGRVGRVYGGGATISAVGGAPVESGRTGSAPEAQPTRKPAFPSKVLKRVGESGYIATPTMPGRRITRFLRKHFTKLGLKPKFLFEAIVARDGQLAKHASRIDILSRDLARQIRRYKGPLSYPQLTRYLDDAYRGMNLRTGGELLDDVQIKRIAGKRGVAESRLRDRAAETAQEAGLKSAPEFIPIIREIRAHTDAITRSMRRAGLLDDAVARELERSFGLYSHRQYEAVRNEKWAERIKREPLWNRAFELTKSKWDRAVAEDRAREIVHGLKLRKPKKQGQPEQGDRVRVGKPGQDGTKHGTLVQVVDGTAYVEVRDADGKRQTVEAPYAEIALEKGTVNEAVADLTRALRDPSLMTDFFAEYSVDTAKFLKSEEAAAGKHPGKTEKEIWGILQQYIEKTGSKPIMPGGVPEGSKDLSVLRERTSKDDFERMLMGESRHVGANFAATALKMATLLEQHKFLKQIEAEGKQAKVFRERPEVEKQGTDKEEAYTKPIDPDKFLKALESAEDAGPEPGIDRLAVRRGKGRTAPLSGLYTSQEILDELNDVFDQHTYPDWLKWWFRFSFAAKGAVTAGSIQSANRNFLSNFLSVMANGVNPLHYDRAKAAGLVSYPRVFGSTDRQRQLKIERYLELGLFDQGTDLGDLKRLERHAQIFKGTEPGAGSAGARAIRFAGEFYQAPDNFAKAFTFEALVPQYRKAMPGKTLDEVERHVAGILRDTMQNYSAVPRGVKALGQFPVIAPFVSFFEEVARTSKNIAIISAQEMRSKNSEMRKLGAKKAVGFVAALGVPLAAASAAEWLLNMDDEDDEAARRFMAPWNRNSTVFYLISNDNEIRFVDASFMDFFNILKQPFIQILKGNLDGAIEEAKRPLGEDLVTGAAIDVMRNRTAQEYPVYNRKAPWLDRQLAKGKHVGKTLLPGTLKTAERIADPKRKWWDEVMAVFGPRIVTVNIPREMKRRSFAYKRDLQEGRELEKEPVKMGGEATARQKRLSEEAVRQLAGEMIETIKAAQRWGVADESIREPMSKGGIGKWEIEALMNGDIEQVVDHYRELNASWTEEKIAEREAEEEEEK